MLFTPADQFHMLGERPWAVQPWMTKLLSVNSANKARNNLRKDRVMFEWFPIPIIPRGRIGKDVVSELEIMSSVLKLVSRVVDLAPVFCFLISILCPAA